MAADAIVRPDGNADVTTVTLEADELERLVDAYQDGADRLAEAGSPMEGPFRDQLVLLEERARQARRRAGLQETTRLRKAREMSGLSVNDVVQATGAQEGVVLDWEAGKARPSPDELASLAALYGVSGEWLLREDG